MTSRERFEAEFVKLGGELLDLRTKGAGYLYTDIARAFGLWQAAERDMLERCVKACGTVSTYHSLSDPAYVEGKQVAKTEIILAIKELLNEQH